MAIDANIKNLQTIGDIWMLTSLIDPSDTGGAGINAPEGSLAIFGNTLYIKNSALGGTATDWSPVSEGSGNPPWEIGGNVLTADSVLGSSSASGFDVRLQAQGVDYISLKATEDNIEIFKDIIATGNNVQSIGASGNQFLEVATRDVTSYTSDLNLKATGGLDNVVISGGSGGNVTLREGTNIKLEVGASSTLSNNPIDMNTTNKIINLADGVNPKDAVNKSQLDAVSAGLDYKESVRVASTANLGTGYTHNGGASDGIGDTIDGVGGALAIDGVTLADGDRVLVKDQTNVKQNGIYTYDQTAQKLVRATDHDGSPSNEVSGGNVAFVEQGTTYENYGFVLQGDGNLVPDGTTDDIVFTTFSAVSSVWANQTLSNLTSPTAVNQNLLPAGSELLGSPASRWGGVFSEAFQLHEGGASSKFKIDSSGGIVTLEAGIDGDTENIKLSTSSQGTAINSGNIDIVTGDATEGTNASGNINLKVGASTAGDSGIVTVNTGATSHNLVLLTETDASDKIAVMTMEDDIANAITRLESSIITGLGVPTVGGKSEILGGGIDLEADGTFTSGDATISSGTADNTSATNFSISTGNVNILTSDALKGGTGANANTGNILIKTGAPAGGTRGTIILDANARDARLATQPVDNSVPLAIATTQYVTDSISAIPANDWAVGGNTTPSSPILGTTDASALDVQSGGALSVFTLDEPDSGETSGAIVVSTGAGTHATSSSSGAMTIETGAVTQGGAVGGLTIRTGEGGSSTFVNDINILSGARSGVESGGINISTDNTNAPTSNNVEITTKVKPKSSLSNLFSISKDAVQLKTSVLYQEASVKHENIGTSRSYEVGEIQDSTNPASVYKTVGSFQFSTGGTFTNYYVVEYTAIGMNKDDEVGQKVVAYKRTAHVRLNDDPTTPTIDIILESSDFTSEQVPVSEKSDWDIRLADGGSGLLAIEAKAPVIGTLSLRWTTRMKVINGSTVI